MGTDISVYFLNKYQRITLSSEQIQITVAIYPLWLFQDTFGNFSFGLQSIKRLSLHLICMSFLGTQFTDQYLLFTLNAK